MTVLSAIETVVDGVEVAVADVAVEVVVTGLAFVHSGAGQ